jgi:hypothetical protein
MLLARVQSEPVEREIIVSISFHCKTKASMDLSRRISHLVLLKRKFNRSAFENQQLCFLIKVVGAYFIILQCASSVSS